MFKNIHKPLDVHKVILHTGLQQKRWKTNDCIPRYLPFLIKTNKQTKAKQQQQQTNKERPRKIQVEVFCIQARSYGLLLMLIELW